MSKRAASEKTVAVAWESAAAYKRTDPKAFAAAAKAYTAKVTTSKASARAALRKAGIITASGKIASPYK